MDFLGIKVEGSQTDKAFFCFWVVLMVCCLIVTVVRCWRAIAQIHRWRHLRAMEEYDRQIELEKAKRAAIPLAVAPVAPPEPVKPTPSFFPPGFGKEPQ